MTPDDFVSSYEAALRSQSWSVVAPLVHDDACITFSTGAVHKGKAAVQKAFEANFASIEEEKFSISNVHWVMRAHDLAAYLFDFAWSGLIDGRPASGSGRGTCVLARSDLGWQLIIEHLTSAT